MPMAALFASVLMPSNEKYFITEVEVSPISDYLD
jgi:hypothetical protein